MRVTVKKKNSNADLIIQHVPLVKAVVDRIYAKLPQGFEYEDLISVGKIGLVSAASRYDKEYGVLFKTFAERRIKGAILDSLRLEDTLTCNQRSQQKKIESVICTLEHELGRSVSDEEIANRLGMSTNAYHTVSNKIQQKTYLSLNDDSEDVEHVVHSIVNHVIHPDTTMMLQEVAEYLRKQIESFSPREQLVLALYYYEHINLVAIGELLGLTASRISQIINKLTNTLGGINERTEGGVLQ